MLEIRKGADVGRHEGGGAGLWRREGDQRRVIPRLGVFRRSNSAALFKMREGWRSIATVI